MNDVPGTVIPYHGAFSVLLLPEGTHSISVADSVVPHGTPLSATILCSVKGSVFSTQTSDDLSPKDRKTLQLSTARFYWKRLRRRALSTTDTEERDMAAPASMGDMAGPPKRSSTPAATGTRSTL